MRYNCIDLIGMGAYCSRQMNSHKFVYACCVLAKQQTVFRFWEYSPY